MEPGRPGLFAPQPDRKGALPTLRRPDLTAANRTEPPGQPKEPETADTALARICSDLNQRPTPGSYP